MIAAKTVKKTKITSTAPTAPNPGLEFDDLVSSFKFNETSHPQKKNREITAPLAKDSGVNANNERSCQLSWCRNCPPSLFRTRTEIMNRMASSQVVISICILAVRPTPRTTTRVTSASHPAAHRVTAVWEATSSGAKRRRVAVAAGMVAATMNSADATSRVHPAKNPRRTWKISLTQA